MTEPAVSTEPALSTGIGRPSNPVRTDVTGATLWFTGLPSAGKSTIAHALADDLRATGIDVHVLDGDDVRPYLSKGLGFSREDRDINVTRIGYVARLLSSHGVLTLVPVIAPFASARNAVRADHAKHAVPYGEVFVSTSLEITEQRDVKGLYAKARRGEITGMTGIDDPYEEPTSADLVIDTGQVPLTESVVQTKALASALLGRDLP
ncbi:adenylyl-sulfate kinase [Microlunatus soli]|uniref:Adenylyl-sulfate kinase n=1 Tax=Microlunatus soli TaxID=630515 RepID=A0A1H2AQ01_9ACTN|nr:adenylyl-sulfate kinase [Microlunatus soli]SDT48048.1 adenylylsulfate kinase [Microlunatus soli]